MTKYPHSDGTIYGMELPNIKLAEIDITVIGQKHPTMLMLIILWHMSSTDCLTMLWELSGEFLSDVICFS